MTRVGAIVESLGLPCGPGPLPSRVEGRGPRTVGELRNFVWSSQREYRRRYGLHRRSVEETPDGVFRMRG